MNAPSALAATFVLGAVLTTTTAFSPCGENAVP